MSTFWRVVWIVARKDLAIEARSRELLNTTIFFALSCVIVFSVSFVGEGGDGRALGDAAAGILWIAIAFSGTLALGRTFERERYGDTLRALLLAPGTRAAVYVGKLVGIVALLIATEIVIVPLVALLFQARLWRSLRAGRRAAALRHGRLRDRRHVVRRHADARAQPRRALADPAVSGHNPRHDRGRARHQRAARGGAAARHGAPLGDAASGI